MIPQNQLRNNPSTIANNEDDEGLLMLIIQIFVYNGTRWMKRLDTI
jgi:hypothetical protein